MSERVPRYCRQRETDRPDRAFCRIDGKKVMLGRFGSQESKVRYAELLAKSSKKISPKSTQEEADATISELILAYLTHADEYFGYKSAMWHHLRSMVRLLREHYGAVPAREFRAKRLKQLRKHWVAQGWSRRYVNEHSARLKRMFRWGTSEEMIPTETYQSLCSVDSLKAGKCEAHDTEPIAPVSDADVAKTLEHLPEQVAVMVQVQRFCGCRPGELTKIRKKDIDRSDSIWVVELVKHKTLHRGKRRFIHFGPRAQVLLLPRLVCGDDDQIFPMRRDSYRRSISRAAAQAGVAHWSPNQLRHAAGTEAREVMGLEAAQMHLGHSHADTTEIYAEVSLKKAKEVARKIG